MIARDGWIFIIIGIVLTVVVIWMATRWDSRVLFGVGIFLSLATLFVVYFFRDPERTVVSEPGMLIAPADGRIVLIDTLASHPFVGPNTIQVSIFLSVFNVHVNRVPASGRIDYVKYHPGKFMAAYLDKASLDNEQTEIGMTADWGRRITFKQIAGILARRIVYRLSEGDSVSVGSRFGMIKFGSRVDLLVPADSRIAVKVGDRVRGGETVMAYLSATTSSSENTSAGERTDVKL
jgi:phosphatidylserine decarboxylase